MVLLTGLRIARAAAMLLALLLAVGGAVAQPSAQGAHALKAAFLYNFTKFIDWPAAAFQENAGKFTVCAFADPGFGRELQAILRGEQVGGREVDVVLPDRDDAVQGCQVVYFSAEEASRATRLLPALGRLPVLTVGEGPQFLERGGLIEFNLIDRKVRFDINKRGAEAAGLNMSSKLLRIANTVDGERSR
jgi:hypothetical protein